MLDMAPASLSSGSIISALDVWKGTSLPAVASEDWDSSSAFLALAEIKRLRGQLAAAQAAFTTIIEPVTGRDTKETLQRELGLSSREASKAQRAASVVRRAPLAASLLGSGRISTEHLAQLSSIENDDDVAALLTTAATETPDEFSRTVDEFRINKDAKGCSDRARNARTLKFFDTQFGVGFRGVLPAIEGGRLRTLVNEICDRNWRKVHPERAEVLGGHDDEPRDRRMADALLQITGCASVGEVETGDAESTDDAAADDSVVKPPTIVARTALVVTVNPETLEAAVLGKGPIPINDALALTDDPRTELYAMISTIDGAILRFGRSRRFASPLQKLAMAVRQDGRCAAPGCLATCERLDADHDPPFESGGRTDVETMDLYCERHHAHRHATGAHRTELVGAT
jgi:hypothetical protein